MLVCRERLAFGGSESGESAGGVSQHEEDNVDERIAEPVDALGLNPS